jgi:hypothetical protein
MSVPSATRTGNTSYRWTAGGGLEQSGFTRYVHNPAGESGGDIMSSRLRSNGHDTVCYEPRNEGTRVQLAFALKEGFVREVAPGVYEDARALHLPGQQPPQPMHLPGQQGVTPGAQPQEMPAELQGVFDDAEDAAWRAEFADVPEPAFNAAMAGAVNAVTLGGDFAAAAATLSRETGMDPSAALEKVENGVWAQKQVVDRALSKIGIPAEHLDAFYEAARNQPGKLQSAILVLLHGRDVSQFQQWGSEWLAKRSGA